MDKSAETSRRILNIGWCSFDVKEKKVKDEGEIFINPSNAFILTPKQRSETGIEQVNLASGFQLKDALAKFNDNCYYNYTSHNKSFCLVCLGDDLLTTLLP